ncbi:peptidoglycan DD-metalloendopeptidase family protein [Yoonia sp. BS5-3]|uniref:Murein hydrolase activator EnvC n=1 Tax=Yoonia phaeophyticola TaxID=3137369 RepID=A0ABZ2V874_9RHOB
MKILPLLLCLASPLAAQQEATDAAAQLQAARAMLEEAQTGRDRIEALTETVQAYEAGLVTMRAGLREIALQEAMLADRLELQQAEHAQLLGALSAISQTPRPVTFSHPQGAAQSARAAMLMTDMAAALQAQATAMRTQLDQAATLRGAREEGVDMLQSGLEGAQAARTALGQAVSDRVDLPTRFDADPLQTALLLASAETLADFATGLAAQAPDARETVVPTGSLALPVAGIVLPQTNRPGVTIAAAPQALVTTPIGATVLFQGPLLDYGTVVILEPSADVMFVLVGLDKVLVQPGEILPVGAPIGFLADVDRILTENEGSLTVQAQQTLYLEVRDGQSAINVDRWFALE